VTTAAPNWSTAPLADRLASYQAWVLRKIREGSNPAGVETVSLTTGRELQRRLGLEPRLAEVLLGQLRAAGVVAYTNGRWWIRSDGGQ
jgi:hypothetical protein